MEQVQGENKDKVEEEMGSGRDGNTLDTCMELLKIKKKVKKR